MTKIELVFDYLLKGDGYAYTYAPQIVKSEESDEDDKSGPEWQVDEELWAECQAVIPRAMPQGYELPALLGFIGDMRILATEFHLLKIEEDPDLVEANNSVESPWIAKRFGKDTIILDAAIITWQQAFNLYHENHEVRLMKEGMEYDDAHDRANHCEMKLRKETEVPRFLQ